MNRHKTRTRKVAWAALATAAALCLALAPAASALDLADVRAGSGGLDFVPQVENGGFVLTVSGPEGFHHRAEFGAGESPSFSIFANGGVLPDGVYNYELTAMPTESQRRDAFEANQIQKTAGGVTPRVQTGAFSVVGGAVVAGGETEPGQRPGGSGPVLAEKVQVINQDLVVQGSICAGLDCVSSENFGFDTIRMKENNTRIKFEDTSVGTFPSTDWQLTANDSASGGQNRFSIEDITSARVPFTIEGSAPTNSLWVDSSGNVGGNVGLGTSTPVVDLHVVSGNSPTLRLEQNGSSGFSAQTYDIAANEVNFFVRDVTTGSKLPFRLRPGAPTSSIDVAANGDVGIGTSSPQVDLDVVQTNANTGFRLQRAGNPVTMLFEDTTAAQSWEFKINAAGAFAVNDPSASGGEMTLESNGNLTVKGDFFSATCTSPGSPCAPDYVFAPDYELMPLEDLRAFVTENRHLPNVPSEADLRQARQINLSKFQLTLLEKVEELTLYTLSLHETIEDLKSDRDSKSEALAALEEKLALLEAGAEVE